MATIKSVESQIFRLEGFEVSFTYSNGRNIREDKTKIPGYHYERAARNNHTVAEWTENRFAKHYPGYGVIVKNGAGKLARGNTRIENLRASYE